MFGVFLSKIFAFDFFCEGEGLFLMSGLFVFILFLFLFFPFFFSFFVIFVFKSLFFFFGTDSSAQCSDDLQSWSRSRT